MQPGTTIHRRSDPPPGEPARFGRFRLLQRLGAGSVADVWRAEVQRADGRARVYALKRLRRVGGDVAELTAMLEDEARVCELLVHPNIVRVHELGSVDGECYLAMEHVDGHDLATVLGTLDRVRHRLPIPVAALVARQLAFGLAHAHALRDQSGRHLGIVHRDVSPGNVMVTRAGAVKLLDFGIAKIASHLRQVRTAAGLVKGHVPYMAPEQLLGRPLDARTDVFALGVVLWEMLVMRALFWDPDPRLAAANLLRGPLTVPSAARREVPPALDSVVMKALARNPDERWPSADDLAEALDRFVGDAGQSQTDLAHIVSAITTHLPESSHWSETAPPPVATAPAATASQAQRAPVAPSVAPIAPVGPDVKPSGRRRVAADEPTEQTDVGTRPYPQRRAGRRRAIDLGGPTLGRMATVALLAGAVGAAAVLLGQLWLGSEVTAVLPPAAGLRAAPQAPALALEPPGPAPGAAQPPPAIVPLPAAALELAAPVVAAPVRATGALVRSVAASPRRRGTSAGRHEGSSRRRSLGAAPAAGGAAPPAESRGSAKPNPF